MSQEGHQIVTLKVNSYLLEVYIFYVAVLILKTLLMIAVVGFSRLRYRVPANPEDAALFRSKVNRDHEIVERNRRAHLNDLENIPFFIVICFLYIITTEPSVFWASLLIRVYALSRIIYSVVYVGVQSAVRILIYQVGIVINLYLTVSVICHFL